ncbi:hypothetical protein BVX93_01815 [bacterium B13(2017)]|nr:hypothetical protein BVX93_01815 [bacterium B13(2017)]
MFESTVNLIKQLIAKGVKVGVASSSKNCKLVLKKSGLIDLFEVIIGGIVSKELGLKGKPNPDIFIVSAEKLGFKPYECIMVEDAISGIQAGKRGNFGLVIGIARQDDKQLLLSHGADLVVNDLCEIKIKTIHDWFSKGILEDDWKLEYFGFEAEQERLRETLTTVGNGYFGTRGCFEWEKANKNIHYPGTYIAALFNKLPTKVHGKNIYNNDYVNCPNWLLIEFKIGNSNFFRLSDVNILEYKQTLNMKHATLERIIKFEDKNKRVTILKSERIANMDNPHYGAIRYTIKPVNFNEIITIKSSIDGSVINYGVARYRDLSSKHLQVIDVNSKDNNIFVHVRTRKSKIDIIVNSKSSIIENKKRLNIKKEISHNGKGLISESLNINAKKGKNYVFEKIISIYTSKDQDIENFKLSSDKSLKKYKTFEEMLHKHKKAWKKLWNKADILLDGDRFAQKVIRLHIYHLLTTASPHNQYIDASIPARGLHGEAYRGHIFWDELFIFPFYNLHFPEITKSLLLYRYRRLDAARKYAKDHGYKGAMYPWQTADDGSEETQIIHYNPMSGKWDPDLSCLQRHVSIAVAYNVWEYYYCTNDLNFLYQHGAEMMIEISRFWASMTTYDPKDKRYHINNIMGPDEFHEKYPKKAKGGINNNAYTNIMVSWLMHKTIEMIDHLPTRILKKLKSDLSFKDEEIKEWNNIVEKLTVEINNNELMSQFSGYMKLNDLDWDKYKEKYDDIHRMDRILKSEGDSPDLYKLSKQADTLMLFYVLSPGQVKHILKIMGYKIGNELDFMKKNYEYYIKRTSHGSTLSFVVHSSILKYLHTHKHKMWEWFLTALESDIHDIQGGTTQEGIHCGVMGGTIDIIIKSFAGINLFKDRITLDPNVPIQWNKLSFKIVHRNNWFHFTLTRKKIIVNQIGRKKGNILISLGKKDYKLTPHRPLEINYRPKTVL